MAKEPIDPILNVSYPPPNSVEWVRVVKDAVALVKVRVARQQSMGMGEGRRLRVGPFAVDTSRTPTWAHSEMPQAYGYLGRIAPELIVCPIRVAVPVYHGSPIIEEQEVHVVAAQQEVDAVAHLLRQVIYDEGPYIIDPHKESFWMEFEGQKRQGLGGRPLYQQIAWWSMPRRFLWSFSEEVAERLRRHIQHDAQRQLGR